MRRGQFVVVATSGDYRVILTKYFHVKHFGPIEAKNLTRPPTGISPVVFQDRSISRVTRLV